MTSRRRGRAPRDPQLVVLYPCLFVVMAGYGSTLIVLPFHTQRIGGLAGASAEAVAFQVGLLTSVYALAQLLAGPFAGRLGDRVGRRAVLLGGLAGLAATQAAFGLTTSLRLLYALRFLGGLATAGLLVAATAYVADRTTDQERTRGMAWFGTSVSLGLVAGPAMAGVLSRPGVDIGGGAIRIDGYSIPFLFSALLTLGVLAYARTRLSDSPPPTAAVPNATSAGGANAWTGPSLRTLLGLVTAAQYGLAIFEGTFVLYARDRLSLTAAQTSLAFVVCGAVMALLQVPAAGLLAKLASPLSQVAIGFALMGTGIAALLTTSSYPVVLVMIAVLAAGAALVIPNLSALVSTGASANTGLALGWKSSASSLGQFLGPLVGGSLIGWQEDLPFLLAGVMLLAVAAGVAVRHAAPDRGQRQSSQPAIAQDRRDQGDVPPSLRSSPTSTSSAGLSS
jgi:DHA1 family multidrug resistance protein-like MFS transporter